MNIVIDGDQTQIFDDTGKDLLQLLADHGIYLSEITLRMTPSGVSLQAKITSNRYVIETPTNLLHIVEALHSYEVEV